MQLSSSVEPIGTPVTATGRASPDERSRSRAPETEHTGSSEEPRSSAKETVEAKAETPEKKLSGGVDLTQAETEELSERLERALNDAHGTQVKFRVQKQIDNGQMSFAVIERATGKVVREFPPEEVRELAEGRALEDGQGLFVDEAV